MLCVVDKSDLRGNLWKLIRQLDVELDKFEAVDPGVWADNIGVKLVFIIVVVEDEIPMLSTHFGFFLEFQTLRAHQVR